MKQARKSRLRVEYKELRQLGARVALDEDKRPMIEIEPQDVVEGLPPERYLITYRCKSIIKLKKDQNPIFGYSHQIEMYFGQEFLEYGPSVSAVTPIWHPNIDHKYPHHVCANLAEFLTPMSSYADLVVRIGEIIQYKRYHAEWIEPYPLDTQAADWVIKYAEPRGVLGKNNPIDSSPLLSEMWSPYQINSDDMEDDDNDDVGETGFKMGEIKKSGPENIFKIGKVKQLSEL